MMYVNTGIIAFLLVCFTFSSCISPDKAGKKEMPFYVGTYTNGESEGIYRYQLQTDGTLTNLGLAAKTENPSYLTKSVDGKYLLAANENNDDTGGGGTLSSFLIKGDSLQYIDQKSSGGASPCFVSTNPSGYVLAANYSSGNVALLKLNPDGYLKGPLDVQQHNGEGTHARQEGPHAHSAWFTANDEIISVDLGTNELWFSKLDRDNEKLAPLTPNKLGMAPGSGPRHLAIHPSNSWIYVLNELSSTVALIKKNVSGQYEIVSTQSTLPLDYQEESIGADIHVSSDGNFLYASNRGHNSIVIYQINNKDGSLKLVGHEGVHGDWPRNFAISPDGNFLLIANQRSNNIVSFRRNQQTGTLTFLDEIGAPNPVCLLF